MEAIENNATPDQAGSIETTTPGQGIFVPADVAEVFGAQFLDREACRKWVLNKMYWGRRPRCPVCQAVIDGPALQRFWEGKRICCRACGKFFTALTGTFIGGAHFTYEEIVLIAVFLHLQINPKEIARILKVSAETVRLWEIKFRALGKVRDTLQDMAADEDHTDDVCPCGDPDCSRPFGHEEEGARG